MEMKVAVEAKAMVKAKMAATAKAMTGAELRAQ
jgi:hypothetical protein